VIQNNLTKKDISINLSKKKGFSVLHSKKIIDNLIIVFIKNLLKKDLILKNIGTFKVINKKERIGRNPKTKEVFVIKIRKSISFKTSKRLNKILND
jgi:integration host factor subunit alpha